MMNLNLFLFAFCFHQATCKHERRMATLLVKKQHIHKRMEEAERRFLENDGCLHRVENEMKLLGPDAQPPEVNSAYVMSFGIDSEF